MWDSFEEGREDPVAQARFRGDPSPERITRNSEHLAGLGEPIRTTLSEIYSNTGGRQRHPCVSQPAVDSATRVYRNVRALRWSPIPARAKKEKGISYSVPASSLSCSNT